ncbi:MAG: DUF4349 domain-containing protein [Anaerolineaceae bacterium]
MKTKRLLFLLVICILVLSSCASRQTAATPPAYDKSYGNGISAESPSMAAAPEMGVASQDAISASGVANATANTTKQMVVTNASLSILVDDPAQSLADVMKLATDLGGYTVSSNRYQSYTSSGLEVPAASVEIRVPSPKLNDAMDKIKAMTGDPAKFVTNESVSGQDVTQAYTDLQSRLRNLEQAAEELTKLYDKATKTDDVLAIYNQKMQVTEQIEVLKGQIKYYEDASATSSISLQLDAKATAQPITVAGWQPTGIARNAIQALIDFLKGLANFLIWVIILVVPIVLILGLPIFFLVRWLTRRNKAKKAQQNQMPPLPKEK